MAWNKKNSSQSHTILRFLKLSRNCFPFTCNSHTIEEKIMAIELKMNGSGIANAIIHKEYSSTSCNQTPLNIFAKVAVLWLVL